MALEHRETTVNFLDTSKQEEWEVIYVVRGNFTKVEVWCNDEEFFKYSSIPDSVKSKAKHPNKTQALAIIKLAKKEKKNEKN